VSHAYLEDKRNHATRTLKCEIVYIRNKYISNTFYKRITIMKFKNLSIKLAQCLFIFDWALR